MIPNPMVLMTQDMPGLPANGRTANAVEEDTRDSPITMTEPSAATSCCQVAMLHRSAAN